MLERIVYASVFVSNQDKALDFYTRILGLERRVDNPAADGPRFLTVAVEGQDFELSLWPGTPGGAQPVDGRVPAAYTIETGDIRKSFEALKSRGVKFETEVLEQRAIGGDRETPGCGHRLQLRDPVSFWTMIGG